MAYQTVNPANNQLIKTYPAHSDADVVGGAAAGGCALPFCPGKGDIEPRLAVLHKLADLIDSRAEELAKIASRRWGNSLSRAAAK